MKTIKNVFSKLVKNQIFIPLMAMFILLIVNLIFNIKFFQIDYFPNASGFMTFHGNLIDVLDFGSELAILAIGMTFVTAASGGQDISVGAAMAIAGSVILRVLCGENTAPETLRTSYFVAFLVAFVVALIFGAFNGVLVSVFKIQPMVATLILFTAGRSIASMINNGELPVIKEVSFSYFGGYIPGIPVPTPALIAIVVAIITFLILKFTNLGLYIQAVGINDKSSRLNGLNATAIKIIAFVLLGACVAVAGLIKVSRFSTINYSVIAKDIEMDAILAVALGGNALGGGKFNMAASILGAYVIQTLTTTLYAFRVQSDALPAYKAVVVILLVVFSAPTVRAWMSKTWKKITAPKNESKEVA